MTSVQFIESVPIKPVAMDRVQRLRNGRRVVITGDVGDIAARLKEIDQRFHLTYEPGEALYVLELHDQEPDGSIIEHFVGVYDELDARIIERARKVASPDYDLAAEIEKSEREAAAAHEHQRQEMLGDASERLAHALRKDLSRHEIGATKKSRASLHIPRAFTP